MREEFRQLVIEALRRGEELPPEWAKQLFPPEKREYELTYHGKERQEDIIANALAVPLQPVRTFGQAKNKWGNLLIFGDNLQVMKTLLRMKEDGLLLNEDGSRGVKVVYIDPPFATKRDFQGKQQEKAYQDKLTGAAFIEFIRNRLILLRELMHPEGSIYIHLDQKKVHYIKVIMDEVFGEHNFRNEIIWRNTNSHSKAETFGNIHQTILFYSRSSSIWFHKYRRPPFKQYIEDNFQSDEDGLFFAKSDLTAEGVRSGESGKAWRGYDPTIRGRHWAIPSWVYALIEDDISHLGQIDKLNYLYNNGHIYLPDKEGGQPRIKKPLTDDIGNYLMDIWAYQPYTQGVHLNSDDGIDEDVTWALSKQERIGYPTQKPEGLLKRILESSSKPGDIVLDVFAGSGTTCTVAEKMGRRWIAIDSGKLAIYTIQKRLLKLKTTIRKGISFTLYNAGLYDFSKLRLLPWRDWRFFALQLFDCKDEPHSIGGLMLDGKKQGASVLVFNHLEHPGQRIDEGTVYSIHTAVGSRVGNRFFIIAPRNTFDFQQDYIDYEGVRYYALRIPYSFINELHHREFSALLQPHDEAAVNNIVDAVGFDFIRPPKVEWSIRPFKPNYCRLEIHEFQSRAYIRGQVTYGGLETLSLVMIDNDFEGEVFDLDVVYYGHQLSKQRWQISFKERDLGEQVMIVFIDIYGNESRVLIPKSEFHNPTTGKQE